MRGGESVSSRRKHPASRLVGVVALALLAGGYFWMRNSLASSAPEPETARVHRETLDRAISATGVIRPMVGAEIEVGSRVSGIVRSIPVRVGDAVEREDLLARIDATELRAETERARADLDLAEAQLELARSVYRRSATLARDGIVAATELDTAAQDLDVARARVARERARLSTAQIQLGYTEIRAPIRGVIADVTTREGETVAASFAAPTFVTIVDLERLEVQAYVDETDIGRIFVGQRARFTVDTYPEAEFDAEVTAVNPRAELQNGVVNYIVLLRFEPGGEHVLRPEMTAHVRVQLEQRADVLTVPRRAVRRDAGGSLVTVLRDGIWVEQVIETGWRTNLAVEVRQGLAESETVQINRE